jgi:hypothetical protein
MTAIKYSVQRQMTSSAIPMGRALQQWQFWLSRLLLVKTKKRETNTVRKIGFVGSIILIL